MVEGIVESFKDELARRILCLLLRVEELEERDDREGRGLEEDGNLLEWLLNFFFPETESSTVTCRTLVSFKPAGRTQLQSKPSKCTGKALIIIRIKINF